jgi:hypothetical protein
VKQRSSSQQQGSAASGFSVQQLSFWSANCLEELIPLFGKEQRERFARLEREYHNLSSERHRVRKAW